MADALEPCNFEDGQEIVRQGEQGEDFFIIAEVSTVEGYYQLASCAQEIVAFFCFCKKGLLKNAVIRS